MSDKVVTCSGTIGLRGRHRRYLPILDVGEPLQQRYGRSADDGETGADKAYKDAMWAGQVIAYGLNPSAISARITSGRWRRLQRQKRLAGNSVFTTFAGTELEGAENLRRRGEAGD
ncbi:MAG: hypothetical protein ACLS4Z_00145 [Christensenellaceae bacterium]